MSEFNYPGIMDIPREVRGVIYNKLPQSEILLCRLVCSTWKKEIDELFEFSLTINDANEPINWKRLEEIHCIKSITVQHFMSHHPKGDGAGYFKFPSFIKSLEIHAGTGILPSNFYYLLSDCASCLKSLSIQQFEYPLLSFDEFETSFAEFNFRNLETLTLSVSTLPTTTTMEGNEFQFQRLFLQKEPILFLQFMENSSMKKLKELHLDLKLLTKRQLTKTTRTVLNFISQYWRTLEILDVEILQGHHAVPVVAVPLGDDEEIAGTGCEMKVQNLRSLRLISSSPIGIKSWLRLIENQKNLENFEIDLVPVDSRLYTTLIPSWYQTIVNVEISDLSIWTIDVGADGAEAQLLPFDLSIFADCSNLRKLYLDRNVNFGAGTGRRAYDVPELINLYQLPPNLMELALNYFNILSQDILLWSWTESANNITNLTLTQCGTVGEFGVNGSVLERLIILENLIFMEISMLNFENGIEERDKLNTILIEHGYSEGHAYFQWTRKTLPFILIDIEENVNSIQNEEITEEVQEEINK